MIYKICRFFFSLIVQTFWPIIVESKRINDCNNSYILAANHVSYLDPIVLGIILKKPIHFIAKKELFNIPILGYLLILLGAIPIDKKYINLSSIKKSIDLLKNNHILGIFPEGTRSSNGNLLELNSGVVKIALKANVPIVPVGLNGTFEIYPPGAKLPKIFKKQFIYITFGRPIYLDSSRQKDVEYIRGILSKIKNEIKLLSTRPVENKP